MNACRAQAALAPNLTLLQNVQPKQRLAPLVDSLCCEVLGVPGVSHQSHSSPPALYPNPPHRYYFSSSTSFLSFSSLMSALTYDAPQVDSTGREQIDRLVSAYERQHSFFQSADLNASRVLRPLLEDLVAWSVSFATRFFCG